MTAGNGARTPAGAAVVDATGKTLLAGLIDPHTHSCGDALREAVVFGVTTGLDMFTDPPHGRHCPRGAGVRKCLANACARSCASPPTGPPARPVAREKGWLKWKEVRATRSLYKGTHEVD